MASPYLRPAELVERLAYRAQANWLDIKLRVAS
jgi:hypothetical protein